MALVDDIIASRKLETYLAVLLKYPEDDSLASQFRVAVTAKQPLTLDNQNILTPDGKPVPGVSVQRGIAGKFYLATATMEGLKALVDDNRVTFISSSKKAHPL